MHGISTFLWFGLIAIAMASILLISISFLSLFAFFDKEEDSIRFHIFANKALLTPKLFGECSVCGDVVKYSCREIPSAENGAWVVEVILTSSLARRAVTTAINDLHLPVIRKENRLIVLGVYKNKVEATEIIGLLKNKYNIRGWVVENSFKILD